MQEMVVQSLGQEDSLEKEVATYSSLLSWEVPWIEEPGRPQSMGSQRVRHNLVAKHNYILLPVCTSSLALPCGDDP